MSYHINPSQFKIFESNYPIDISLRCLMQHEQYALQVFLELGPDGQGHIAEHGQNLWLDLAFNAVVTQRFEKESHNIIAKG